MTLSKDIGLRKLLPVTSTPCWQLTLIWTMFVLATTSCTTGIKRTPVPAPIPAPLLALLIPLPTVGRTLTQSCPKLPSARDDRVTSLIENHQDVAARYHACAARQAGLSRASQERERLEAARIERARAALQRMRP